MLERTLASLGQRVETSDEERVDAYLAAPRIPDFHAIPETLTERNNPPRRIMPSFLPSMKRTETLLNVRSNYLLIQSGIYNISSSSPL